MVELLDDYVEVETYFVSHILNYKMQLMFKSTLSTMKALGSNRPYSLAFFN
jgi:hypothetical protein